MLTDNEIKKALELCLMAEYKCDECPYQHKKHFDRRKGFEIMPNGVPYDQFSCHEWLKMDCLDLINCQKAEIERLRAECKNQSTLWSEHYESLYQTALGTIKPQSVKEFAEKCKVCFPQIACAFDCLAKGMVGEQRKEDESNA